MASQPSPDETPLEGSSGEADETAVANTREALLAVAASILLTDW